MQFEAGRRYLVKTLGCKANLYDSQLLEAELQKRGWAPWSKSKNDARPASLCIVNSCTVTDEADRQSRKLASRLGREHPGASVVVTGCGAEVDPERLAGTPGVHYVIGNRDKPELVEILLGKLAASQPLPAGGEVLGRVSGYAELLSRHPMDREWSAPEQVFAAPPASSAGFEGFDDKTRAFIKIQEGCNSFCTYCIIPYGRGPSRSLEPAQVVAQVRGLVAQGIREVVVTGTNIGDYGVDWGGEPGAAFAELCERILGETGLNRLRLSSLDPVETIPRLLEFMAREPRMCPHFHVSLQAIQPRILKLMKRKYGVSEAVDCLRAIDSLSQKLGKRVFVGMDVITGFPGETSAEFEEGVALLESLPWSRLHVFSYSERKGTPATRLPGSVMPAERASRARRLSALSLARIESHYRDAWRSLRDEPLSGVLLEKPSLRGPRLLGEGEQWVSGLSLEYLRVWVRLSKNANSLRNQSAQIRIEDVIVDSASGDAAFVGKIVE